MNLRVIEGIKKEKPDYCGMYNRIFTSCIKDPSFNNTDLMSIDLILKKKIIYFGVKMLNSSEIKNPTLDYTKATYSLANAIKNLMSFITPNEFESIFPIEKKYDGKRWGCKDYFFTKKMINKIGPDTLIGNEIDEFLWDYQNWDVSDFLVDIMGMSDNLRRSEGKQGIIEKFFEEKGLPTYTLYEDEEGQKHLRNNDTNEVVKVKKPKPRYLNLVKEKPPIPDQGK